MGNEWQAPTPSGASTGYFQTLPTVPNQFYDDAVWKRLFAQYLSSPVQDAVSHDLSRFGAHILSPEVLNHVDTAERQPPFVRSRSAFGQRKDELVTSSGWQALQSLGIREGMVATAYQGRYGSNDRMVQFLKLHLWSGSCASVTCPSAMQDGAARLLKRELRQMKSDGGGGQDEDPKQAKIKRAVFQAAYDKLVSKDPTHAWTSGQWMTERTGGSDVSRTETIATYAPQFGTADGSNSGEDTATTDADGNALGPWRIDGFKWFSSATDAQMTVLLAKSAPSGRISAFFAPTRRQRHGAASSDDKSKVELNGIEIQALKSKLGTRPLPTAELSLRGMRAHMLGQAGAGTRVISTVLNITRLHTAISAVGCWGRGLAISRAFARVRRVTKSGSFKMTKPATSDFTKPDTSTITLVDVPAHMRTLAANTVRYAANMQLAFFVVACLGVVEHAEDSGSGEIGDQDVIGRATPPPSIAVLLLRLLTPVAKATTSKAAITGLQECMESLGGVGYLENSSVDGLDIARLFRDANVLSIWEGTTDVLGTDLARVLKAGKSTGGSDGGTVLDAFDRWMIQRLLGRSRKNQRNSELASALDTAWHRWRQDVESASRDRLAWAGRESMDRLAWLSSGILLLWDASRVGNDPLALEIATRWIQAGPHAGLGADGVDSSVSEQEWADKLRWDRKIVFGDTEDDNLLSKL